MRKGLLAGQHQTRQQIGRDGRNHAEMKRPRQRLDRRADHLDQRLGIEQQVLTAPRHLSAERREQHPALGALDQLGAEHVLKLGQTCRQ
jgi:hypothetical protein